MCVCVCVSVGVYVCVRHRCSYFSMFKREDRIFMVNKTDESMCSHVPFPTSQVFVDGTIYSSYWLILIFHNYLHTITSLLIIIIVEQGITLRRHTARKAEKRLFVGIYIGNLNSFCPTAQGKSTLG